MRICSLVVTTKMKMVLLELDMVFVPPYLHSLTSSYSLHDFWERN